MKKRTPSYVLGGGILICIAVVMISYAVSRWVPIESVDYKIEVEVTITDSGEKDVTKTTLHVIGEIYDPMFSDEFFEGSVSFGEEALQKYNFQLSKENCMMQANSEVPQICGAHGAEVLRTESGNGVQFHWSKDSEEEVKLLWLDYKAYDEQIIEGQISYYEDVSENAPTTIRFKQVEQ